MSISEKTRLELMKVTLKFIENHYRINEGSTNTARQISQFYKVLDEALSSDLTSRKLRKIGHPSPFSLGSGKRAFVPFRFLNKGVSTLQELIRSTSLAPIFQKFGQGNDSSHSFVNRNGHSTSPSTEQHPTDSSSTGCNESLAASDKGKAELQKQGSYDWLDEYVAAFCERLSNADLAAINSGAVPTSLMKLLGRVAYNEIERRRCA